jgi:Fur family ferric uptake transcriptional regulator
MIMPSHPDDPLERFAAFIAKQGKSPTPEKAVVAEVAVSMNAPFGVDQLVSEMSGRTDGRRVSRATVYRTLLYMVEAGILEQRSIADRTVFTRSDLTAG